MHTRILMILSAVFLAALGALTLTVPDKVLGVHDTVPDNATMLLIQMMGALYLGFALLNWAARGALTGDVHGRPIAAGNFLHFAIVAILLAAAAIEFRVVQLASSAVVFSAFAIWFGIALFRSPAKAGQGDD